MRPDAMRAPEGNQDGPSEAEPEDPHVKATKRSYSHQRSDSIDHLSRAPQSLIKTSRNEDLFLNLPNSDLRAFNGGFRPDQKESSCKTTCSGFLTLQGFWNNLNHPKTSSGWKVIPLPTRSFLDAPHLEAHDSTSLRTYHSHPGYVLLHLGVHIETTRSSNTPWIRWIHPYPQLDRSEPFMETTKTDRFNQLQDYLWRPGDIPHHLETLKTMPTRTSTHRIKRIIPNGHFPYSATFPILPISHQRLYPARCHDFSIFSTHLYIPRHHSYPPKPPRLKPNGHLPYLDRFPHKWSNGSLYLISLISFLSFNL